MKISSCLFLLLTLGSCCKVQMIFESVNAVQFVNYTIPEIDTFYAIPDWYKAPYTDSVLDACKETTLSLNATSSKTSLSTNASLTILLKDKIKQYQVEVGHSHNEKMGSGRCAGSNTVIDSISVNGINKSGKIIEILK